MGDVYPIVKVAVVQAASVFLDREGSTEKACGLIREAGRSGAQLIAFPEGFIPAHPVWYHHHPATSAVANRLAVELFKNSVEIPGPEIEALCTAAREAEAYVVVGVCEKMPRTLGTMWNSQVWIDSSGRLLGKHQKIMPTVGERLVHMGGKWRYVWGVSDGVWPGEWLDLWRKLEPAGGVWAHGRGDAHPRDELAEPLSDKR